MNTTGRPKPADMDLSAWFRSVPLHYWLGCEVVQMDAAAVVLRLPFRAEFSGDSEEPHFHGGIIAAVVDAAGTFALVAATGEDFYTVDCRVDYLRLARPGTLTVDARVVKSGRTLALADVAVRDARERMVATGRLALLRART